jgi:hypothetical protein
MHFNYSLGDLLIVRTDCLKYFGVMLDSKLDFYRHVYYLRTQALKLLGLIRFITYNFSSLDSLKILYISLVPLTTEYASVVWNNLTLAATNNLENIQRKFCKFML